MIRYNRAKIRCQMDELDRRVLLSRPRFIIAVATRIVNDFRDNLYESPLSRRVFVKTATAPHVAGVPS